MVTVTQTINNEKMSTQGFDADDWLNGLAYEFDEINREKLKKVLVLLNDVVEHQQDIIGDTEVQHAINVVGILATLKIDSETLLATLLYSLVQSSVFSLEEIRQEYGENISNMIDNLSRLHILEVQHVQASEAEKSHQQLESVRKLLLALAEDMRVVLVKLAERLHLMRRLKHLPEKLRRQLATETLDIYAPLANRLGIWQLKWELEDLSFRYLEPEIYKRTAKMLDEKRVDRENFIEQVVSRLREEISKAGIKAEVNGRPKHIYSIWRKMQKKAIGFNELFDVSATRVLVEKVADCYTVLGIVHSLWRPIKSEFDDYIAVPKDNDYQSLHTAVVGPQNKSFEVQIRTKEMHEHSEYGVASHWGYKEGGRHDTKYQEKIAWLRRLLEWKDEDSDEGDLFEQFKTELFDDRVYVLTPQGRVVDLPNGATPLDFAYAIHTEVGHSYRGAKIDGKIVTLGYKLKNGEQVEILTGKSAHPSRDWLNPSLGYANSPRTRTKIRTWFKQQDFTKNIEAGRSILDHELKRLGVSNISIKQILKGFRYTKSDDFLMAVGRGDISSAQIATGVSEFVLPKAAPAEVQSDGLQYPHNPHHPSQKPSGDGVQVMGVGDLLTKMAKCCKPVPEDDITGYITRGRGVTVHRKDCQSLLRLKAKERERFIDVSWGETAANTYPVDIQVRAFDRQGLLHDITLILSSDRLNMTAVNTHTDKRTYIATMSFSVEVADAAQLSRALIKIEHLPNILHVSRK